MCRGRPRKAGSMSDNTEYDCPWTGLSRYDLDTQYTKSDILSMDRTTVEWRCVSPLRPRQNGRRIADDTFKRIFLNKNVRISIEISLKFVPKGPINNIPALVQIVAWRRSGDKPLSEPMMVSLLTHICVTRPQWVINMVHTYMTIWTTGYHRDSDLQQYMMTSCQGNALHVTAPLVEDQFIPSQRVSVCGSTTVTFCC